MPLSGLASPASRKTRATTRAFNHARHLECCNGSTPYISPVALDRLDAVLPLIAGYQRFYGVEAPDDGRNRAFWRRFTAPDGDRGVLLAAWEGESAVGFATVYWAWESIAARDAAVMNDLFVDPSHRGGGVGRLLIDASVAVARGRGLESISWLTAVDNRGAQRLYETYDASRDVWFEYAIDLRGR